ncbi:uncharacterized protein LOC132304976 [Cornus florida]|uniref:uncharacterized protein LOC132304976 n=1 Tax=Cornus florida TaxID=4283 RepID=UPI0028983966|nr:uncharacterized protein LOC132304976 [Cornus florida]
MGRAIVNKVRDNPKCTPKTISTDINGEFSAKMTYMQSWRAKECARHIIEGNPKDSYILVPWLCERIAEYIPGTITSWECMDDRRFKRVFVAYGCSIRGFINYCRPMLAIDACHLSGNYKGTMLGATGFDANDGLWPLAYAVVSSENDDDWHWFLSKVKEILDGRIVTILTDRHPSLISCIRDIFGSQYHSWCLRHLTANFSTSILGRQSLGLRASGKEHAKKLLDKIAYARTVDEYENALAAMRVEKQQKLGEHLMSSIPMHDMPNPAAAADGEGASHLRPPAVTRPPGRPRIKRIESQFQNVRSLHCSRCNENGHNRRKCKAPIPG